MRPRRAAALSLAGGLLLLASLYLPWLTPTCGASPDGGSSTGDLLNVACYETSGSVDGWTLELGAATAVVALILAGAAIVALRRPATRRFPLLAGTLLACYFALAAGAQALSAARRVHPAHLAIEYGAVVWLVALCLLLAGLAALWSGRRPSMRPAWRPASALLVVALLALLLLPWKHLVGLPSSASVDTPGAGTTAGTVAAALGVLLLAGWWSDDRAERWERLGLAAAVALFVCGVASRQQFFALDRSSWAGLAVAVGLLALTLARAVSAGRIALPAWRVLVAGAAAGLFGASLFLPWQTVCYGSGSGFKQLGCYSGNGWTINGSAAALLALALALLVLCPRRLATPAVDLAAGLVLLLVMVGFSLHPGGQTAPGVTLGTGDGALLGFAAAAVLIALAVADLRPKVPDWSRAPARLVPIACCLASLAILVLPSWEQFSARTDFRLSFGPRSWLAIAGILVSVRLLDVWLRRVAGDEPTGLLAALPLALLALVAVNFAYVRNSGLSWGGGSALALALVLAVFGYVENEGGIHSARIPEVLRVDRI